MLIVDALFIIILIALEKCFCFILFYLKFYDLKSRILSVFSMHINELINPLLQRKFLLLPSVATLSKLFVFDHPNGRPNFFYTETFTKLPKTCAMHTECCSVAVHNACCCLWQQRARKAM